MPWLAPVIMGGASAILSGVQAGSNAAASNAQKDMANYIMKVNEGLRNAEAAGNVELANKLKGQLAQARDIQLRIQQHAKTAAQAQMSGNAEEARNAAAQIHNLLGQAGVEAKDELKQAAGIGIREFKDIAGQQGARGARYEGSATTAADVRDITAERSRLSEFYEKGGQIDLKKNPAYQARIEAMLEAQKAMGSATGHRKGTAAESRAMRLANQLAAQEYEAAYARERGTAAMTDQQRQAAAAQQQGAELQAQLAAKAIQAGIVQQAYGQQYGAGTSAAGTAANMGTALANVTRGTAAEQASNRMQESTALQNIGTTMAEIERMYGADAAQRIAQTLSAGQQYDMWARGTEQQAGAENRATLESMVGLAGGTERALADMSGQQAKMLGEAAGAIGGKLLGGK